MAVVSLTGGGLHIIQLFFAILHIISIYIHIMNEGDNSVAILNITSFSKTTSQFYSIVYPLFGE